MADKQLMERAEQALYKVYNRFLWCLTMGRE